MTKDTNEILGTKDVVWQLEDLYSSIDDPAIQKDLDFCLKEASAIRDEYAGKIDSLDAQGLLELVKRLERLSELLGKISAFAFLNFATKSNDPEAGAFLQKIKEVTSQVSKELVFFELEWANLDEEKAQQLLSDPVLEHYRHYLKALRRYKPHLLSETEERLLAEISPVGRSSWINLFDKVLAHQRYGKEERTQEEVLKDLYVPDREVRKKASEEFTEGLKKEILVFTHTFNTVLADKMIEDRLRKYPNWISSMNLANELKDETVDGLIEAVTSRYDIVERYYLLKRKILGLDELYDYDRYAPLPWLPQRSVSWQEAKEIVLSSFEKFSEDMAKVARQFFEKKWIHAPIIPGKTGGAFAHPVTPSTHPYVLVNFTGTLRDVETLAHELGHGVHQVLAAQKGYFNADTPLTLAETASVFGEMLVFQDILSTLSDPKEKLGFTAAKIESTFATVFRQIAMNRFEDGIHNHRRQQGELSTDTFSDYWMETQRAMFKSSVTLTERYRIWWSYISHFLHVPGYVYSYAFGELLVLSLYGLYREEGQPFVQKYIELLKAGGSQDPYELLKPFGIDLNDKGFWHKGLSIIDQMVQEAENLAEKAAF
ncbi:MAG: M3 family oligoendopeptidase [Thermodesulfobacteria bacterium]|nr:M3 family oligoendopeptidase [Thermodesulfobacteriota bacterium]